MYRSFDRALCCSLVYHEMVVCRVICNSRDDSLCVYGENLTDSRHMSSMMLKD